MAIGGLVLGLLDKRRNVIERGFRLASTSTRHQAKGRAPPPMARGNPCQPVSSHDHVLVTTESIDFQFDYIANREERAGGPADASRCASDDQVTGF